MITPGYMRHFHIEQFLFEIWMKRLFWLYERKRVDEYSKKSFYFKNLSNHDLIIHITHVILNTYLTFYMFIEPKSTFYQISKRARSIWKFLVCLGQETTCRIIIEIITMITIDIDISKYLVSDY